MRAGCAFAVCAIVVAGPWISSRAIYHRGPTPLNAMSASRRSPVWPSLCEDAWSSDQRLSRSPFRPSRPHTDGQFDRRAETGRECQGRAAAERLPSGVALAAQAVQFGRRDTAPRPMPGASSPTTARVEAKGTPGQLGEGNAAVDVAGGNPPWISMARWSTRDIVRRFHRKDAGGARFREAIAPRRKRDDASGPDGDKKVAYIFIADKDPVVVFGYRSRVVTPLSFHG